jgi:hypothetical protein
LKRSDPTGVLSDRYRGAADVKALKHARGRRSGSAGGSYQEEEEEEEEPELSPEEAKAEEDFVVMPSLYNPPAVRCTCTPDGKLYSGRISSVRIDFKLQYFVFPLISICRPPPP